ncbi:MAG: hypothetical protein HZA22_07800 [Nitrospirae bacterium]|nr:hypothetical protein [Nitrospirota bacterium]
MKYKDQMGRKYGLVGAGVGLVMFALFGLLQGSLIGGAIGLDIVNNVFHTPAGTTLLSRVIVGASMLAGVLVTGIFFVVTCSSIGWLTGHAYGALTEPKEHRELAHSETKVN